MPPDRAVWLPGLAGAAALLVGIGLARFAYVPLFPAMVGAGLVDGGGAGLLGATNFAGYLAGVLGGRALARWLGVPRALDLGMALAVLSFAACALAVAPPWGLAWYAVWRAMAGVAGGVLMAVTGPAVQASVPPAARPAAGGIVMTGVGTGVVLAGSLLPALLAAGVAASWLALALLTLLLWVGMRQHFPAPPPPPTEAALRPPAAPWLLLAYALSGAGMVPPMVYLADFVVRGHGFPLGAGSATWIGFGVGAIAGGLAGARLAGRFGGRPVFLAWMGVQVVALGLPLLPGLWPLLLAAPLSGFAAIGATAVTLTLARQRAGSLAGVLWVRATAGYAAAQAGGAFALAALFAASGGAHAQVFAAGLAASILALLVALADREEGSRTQ